MFRFPVFFNVCVLSALSMLSMLSVLSVCFVLSVCLVCVCAWFSKCREACIKTEGLKFLLSLLRELKQTGGMQGQGGVARAVQREGQRVGRVGKA